MATSSPSSNGQPAKHPGGRPPKLDNATREELIKYGAVVPFIEDLADLCRISKDTLYRWLATDAELSDAIKNVRAKRTIRYLAKLEQAEPWQAAAWILERTDKRFRQNFQIEGQAIAAQSVSVNIGFSRLERRPRHFARVVEALGPGKEHT
jgi:hypothetical protein